MSAAERAERIAAAKAHAEARAAAKSAVNELLDYAKKRRIAAALNRPLTCDESYELDKGFWLVRSAIGVLSKTARVSKFELPAAFYVLATMHGHADADQIVLTARFLIPWARSQHPAWEFCTCDHIPHRDDCPRSAGPLCLTCGDFHDEDAAHTTD